MLKNLIPILQHRHFTKLCSLTLGYFFWFCIAQYQTVTQSYQAPIYFYDTNHKNITTQDSVQLILQGSRKDIYHFNPEHAVIHLDGSKYTLDNQDVLLGKENLFLPDTIKLIDLIPSYITIQVNSTEKT